MNASTTGSVPQPTASSPLAVALASDLTLFAQAVAGALAGRNIRVDPVSWPQVPRDDPAGRQLSRLNADVGLLIYDVDLTVRMSAARELLRAWTGPWLVLTRIPPGAAWGGLREAGADAVERTDVGLEELEFVLRMLAAGRNVGSAGAVAEQVAGWRALQGRHDGLQHRLDTLTPRERQVLALLRQGNRVRAVAQLLGLSESTVRTQVRTLLGKLELRSQVAAVAALRALDGEGDQGRA